MPAPTLINVIDLEASCWETREPPEGQRHEIIEIGLCTLDLTTLERVRAPRMLVRPVASEVSAYCTALTGIRPEDVAGAPSLAEVLDELERTHALSTRPWASWGQYDRRMLGEAGELLGRPGVVSARHANAKIIHGEARGVRPVGLGKACRAEGVPFEGRAHRGDDDAWNVAGIILRLIGRGQWPSPQKPTPDTAAKQEGG